ncbi:MAG: amidohydrolase family protein [Verrucomicrobiales bacterium]|nr:amidohydrolase family protein [Verrucomicrobiales bacterium]
MLLRARIVLPITAPSLEDGAVLISGGTVADVGAWHDLRRIHGGTAVDLGDVVLLPGLINAHCHLDYTHMAGRLRPPRTFPDWIKSILAAKSEWNYSDYAASWLAGASQLLESGTTTVANIESVPELLTDCRAATPLRVHSFVEMTGVRSGRNPEALVQEALRTFRSLDPGTGAFGLSPHAPYSTTPTLLRLAGDTARRDGLRTTTHVAESQAEFEMFMYRRGPMFDWLEHQRPMDDCGLGSPVQHLERCGLLSATHLAVHVNYLWHGDAERLGRSGTHVVHCPKSHTYFGHHRFPREELEAAAVNCCLGTDSLASTLPIRGRPPRLSLLAELRELLGHDATLSPGDALRLATVNGARALGLAGQLGELSTGAQADLIAIPYGGSPAEAAAGVIAHEGRVAASLIAGTWAIPPASP